MTQITKQGQRLAHLVWREGRETSPDKGYSAGLLETCSLIARHTKTYRYYSVCQCNGELFEGQYERIGRSIGWAYADKVRRDWEKIIDGQLERFRDLIDNLVAELPLSPLDDMPWRAEYTDPRGPGVRLMCGDWDEHQTGIPARQD